MIELFIAVFLGGYYIIKYILHTSKDIAYDLNEVKITQAGKRKKEEWLSRVVDLELEREVWQIVGDVEELKKHKDEIEPALMSALGIKPGAIESECFLDYYDNVDRSAQKMFARILMGNHGKLLETDATFGIMFGITDYSKWPAKAEYYNKHKSEDADGTSVSMKCSEEKISFWLNNQLRKNGIHEDAFVEVFQDPPGKEVASYCYYSVDNDNDLKHILDSVNNPPRKDYLTSCYSNRSETFVWAPMISLYDIGTIRIEPIEAYSYWHERQ